MNWNTVGPWICRLGDFCYQSTMVNQIHHEISHSFLGICFNFLKTTLGKSKAMKADGDGHSQGWWRLVFGAMINMATYGRIRGYCSYRSFPGGNVIPVFSSGMQLFGVPRKMTVYQGRSCFFLFRAPWVNVEIWKWFGFKVFENYQITICQQERVSHDLYCRGVYDIFCKLACWAD